MFTYIVHIYPLGDENFLSLQLWGITEHSGFYKDREGKGSTKGQKKWVGPKQGEQNGRIWGIHSKQRKAKRNNQDLIALPTVYLLKEETRKYLMESKDGMERENLEKSIKRNLAS